MDTTEGAEVGGDEPTTASGPFQGHLPCTFAHKVVSSVVPDFSRPLFSYREEGKEQLFQEYIATLQQRLELTETELSSFHTATRCHICNHRLGGDKVRDHCHIVGNDRGAAHCRCDLAYRISKSEWKLPVHNLKGYDGHLIVKLLKSEFGQARVISQNMENYLSITVDRLKFIDSLQFIPQSLDNLVKILEVDEFKYVLSPRISAHKTERGLPYDYMDSFTRFDGFQLPSQDAFFGKLSDSPCSDVEYAHATQVWIAFECESMADYHDIYLKCVVLLLADFFERFRASCLVHHSLDDVHYYTAPGLAWDATLRMTHVSLEVITDIDHSSQLSHTARVRC